MLRLEDVLENIKLIEDYTQDSSYRLFARDLKTQDAVERCLQRISEAAAKPEGAVETLMPDQPWSEIRTVGNVLRHEYDQIDPNVIWRIVSEDLKPLKHAIETALARLGSPSPDAS